VSQDHERESVVMWHSRRTALKGLWLGGLSWLGASKAGRVASAADVPVSPVPRAGEPGPPMLLGTSVIDAQRNRLVKSLGFSMGQTDSNHPIVNEPEPGHWDWKTADEGLAAMRQVRCWLRKTVISLSDLNGHLPVPLLQHCQRCQRCLFG
jgi:hypothetical protein